MFRLLPGKERSLKQGIYVNTQTNKQGELGVGEQAGIRLGGAGRDVTRGLPQTEMPAEGWADWSDHIPGPGDLSGRAKVKASRRPGAIQAAHSRAGPAAGKRQSVSGGPSIQAI